MEEVRLDIPEAESPTHSTHSLVGSVGTGQAIQDSSMKPPERDDSTDKDSLYAERVRQRARQGGGKLQADRIVHVQF